jgi:hypothetical protein
MVRKILDTGTSVKRIVVGLSCAVAIYGQAQVQVSGRITDQASGTPVAGLAITIIQAPSASSPQPRVYHATSARDGSYAVSLPLGSYRICTEEAEGYLDPCQWQLASTAIVVTAPTTRNIVLQTGRPLIVRIVDSAGLLKVAPSARVIAPAVSASVTDSSGKTRLIPFRRTAGAVHEFSLLVPLASYTLHVVSSVATLAAPDGTILSAAGFNTPINTAALPKTPPSWLPIWLN